MGNTLLVEREGGVVTLTMNRPEKMNSFSLELLREFGEVLGDIAYDPSLQCVIITGAGEKAFCAGADLAERAKMNETEVKKTVATIRRTMDLVENLPAPTIAAINGFAFGGGLEIALACDIRLISENAKVGLTETSLAIIPGAGGTQRLPRIIGKAKAKELIFTARRITGADAVEIGLASKCVPQSELLEEAKGIAAEIAKNGPVALRMAKRAVDKGMEMDLASGLAFESSCYEIIVPTEDRVEGLTAFKEKRPPVYKGR
ncbi:MAG: enoyl-CoA hydratase [Deltaproteobacteria bacterium]|nr:MAG: enoyl-CoA hydratase [Deltaproteobacteria bacterium]